MKVLKKNVMSNITAGGNADCLWLTSIGWVAAFAFSGITGGIGGFILGGVFLTGYALCPDESSSGTSTSNPRRGPR